MFIIFCFGYKMWAIPTDTSSVLKKKNQVKSPSPESRVLETGSNPPIESDRDSGRDTIRWAYPLECSDCLMMAQFEGPIRLEDSFSIP